MKSLLTFLTVLSVCSWVSTAAGQGVQPSADKLNVLLLMADDFRDFGGAFAKDVVKTPNLDRLQARGMRFDRAYVQYPVCNPSRSSMLTGLRAERTGIVSNDVRLRQKLPDIVTLPQLYKENGWHTAALGKIFHLGGGKNAKAKRLWIDAGLSWHDTTVFEATPAGRRMSAGRNVTGGSLRWCAWGAAEGNDDDQPDGQIAAATVAMIDRLGDQPWFIGCGFMKPHDPFIAPKKYFDLYPPDSLKIWVDPPEMTPVANQSVGFGAYGEAFQKFTDREWLELLRAYCACTSFMDAQLGRVLDELDRRQLWDRTIVVFVGDHGYHTGERRWWNKNTLFERSCRAPLIIAAPGFNRGEATSSLVEFIDLYPTLIDLCHLKPPHALPGASLRPILRDSKASVKDAAYTLVTRGSGVYAQSVRTDRWRLTRWSDGQTELYDHQSDPEELRNVAFDQPAIVLELAAKLEKLPVLNRQIDREKSRAR